MLSNRHAFYVSVLTAFLVFVTPVVQAQDDIDTSLAARLVGSAMTTDAPVLDSLTTRAEARGAIRVIATVAAPAGVLPRDLDATQAAELTQSLSSRAAEFGAANVELMPNLPFVVFEANAETLQRLVEEGLVTSLVEDVPEPPTLVDSVPLVNADDAAARGADGSGQAIAILDTGVERNHPFFGGRVRAEACFSSNSTVDGATTVCPGGGTTQTGTGAAAPCTHPRCDHGTHVAGIAAGSNANSSGVAPDADLLAAQVFSLFTDEPGGPQTCANAGTASPCILTYRSDQIRGLQQVLDWRNDFTIAAANMSLGGGSFATCDTDLRKPLVDQLRAQGIATVISSGNDGLTSTVGAPGCITTALTVGNTRKNDTLSGTSNSAEVVDLLAPGTSITSSVLGGAFEPKSGTSMAAPHVAGVAALVWQAAGYGKPSGDEGGRVRDVLTSTATVLDGTCDEGYGMVNAYEAVRAVR